MRYAGLQLSPAEDCWRAAPTPQPQGALKSHKHIVYMKCSLKHIHKSENIWTLLCLRNTQLRFCVRTLTGTNLVQEVVLEPGLCLQCWWLCTCRFLHQLAPHLLEPGCHQTMPGTSYHPLSRWGRALETLSPHMVAPQSDPLEPLLPSVLPGYWGALQDRWQVDQI